MTITEFLLARIAEDEAVARDANPGPWVDDDSTAASCVYSPAADCFITDPSDWNSTGSDIAHIARHDPARVLAECAAKRSVVALHSGGHECPGVGQFFWDDDADWTQPCPTLRHLATPYASHPDYNAERSA